MARAKTLTLVCGLGVGLFLSGCAAPFSKELLVAKPVAPAKPAAPATLPAKDGAEACLALATSLATNGHDADAIAQFERARQYDSKVRGVAHRLAILYDRTGNAKRAAAEFQLALKEDPKNPDLINDVGFYYYNRGRWAEAEQYFRQTLQLKPEHKKAWINLGLALGQQERYHESLDAFGKVVSPAEAKANLAFVLMTRGQPDQAKTLYRQALDAEPDMTLARGALQKLEAKKATSENAATSSRTPTAKVTEATPAAPAEAELIPIWPRAGS